MRQRRFAGTAGLLIALAIVAQVALAQGAALTRGPYLQSTTRDSTIVVWRTDVAGDSVVEYGQAGYTQAVTDTAPVITHAVTLTSLSAGSTYQYRIKTGGVVLHQSALTTAPDPGGDFDFVVIGDSGTGSSAQVAVAAQMLALNPDFMLHTGDVIYPDGQPGGYDQFFFPQYGSLVNHLPVFPSLGNHDYQTPGGQPYLDVFYLPAGSPGGERYYSFDWGDAHFVALDSNLSGSQRSDMLQWLESDLAATTATWKFAFFHHALYTSGPHRNDSTLPALRDALAPRLEQYNVDIVFNGHDHDYERSTPRRDYVPSSKGVVYMVTGGGGAGLYDVGMSDFTAFSAKMHHTVQVRMYGCILSLRAIDTTGAVIDQIALAKCPHLLYLPILLKQP
jgi:hypothetical protein